MIRVRCPNCGRDTGVSDERNRDCDHCGREVPMDHIREQVAALERRGVPVEPAGRGL